MEKTKTHGKVNSKGTKSDWRHTATTRVLFKIIVYLSEVEGNHKSGIAMKTGIGKNVIDDALHFLLRYKIIRLLETRKSPRWKTIKIYALNPIFRR